MKVVKEKKLSYELSKLAHSIGFDSTTLEVDEIDGFYDDSEIINSVKAQIETTFGYKQEYIAKYPVYCNQALLQIWLFEQFNVFCEIKMHDTTPNFRGRVHFNPKPNQNCSNISTSILYNTPEEALEACLKIALENF